MGRPALIVGESSSVSQPLAPINNVSVGQVGQCRTHANRPSACRVSHACRVRSSAPRYVVKIQRTPVPTIRKLHIDLAVCAGV